jgi:beta-galactosidase
MKRFGLWILLGTTMGWAPFTARGQSPAKFAPNRMDTILYGAAFYEENMPYDRLDQDVRMMQQAGINVVRVGESSWGLWEPEDGRFEFGWMDRIVTRLHEAGIKVIMGTPTYSIPAWMFKKHPEISITRLDGFTYSYGIRQDTDLSNPTYRYYCERVIRKIAEHYKDNPAVIGWQLDNETAAHGAANRDVQVDFVNYLRRKFKTVETLNEIWGLNYWGQRLYDWTEVPPREGIINPGWKLEWERHTQSITTDFLSWQGGIVNQYKRPDQFVFQDFAGPPQHEVDEPAVARALDIASVNAYHAEQDGFDGEYTSFAGDFTRSLKQTNYLVTETNAQTMGWDSKSQFPPYDGQLRLDVYSHLASGANMVEYWHWHSNHYGQETYWKGVLAHDLQPNRAYAEVSRTAHELQRVGPQIVDLEPRNQVAILYSLDSYHGIQFMPFSDQTNYESVVMQMYKALYNLNVGTDFIFPESAAPTRYNLAKYKVIVVPPLYVASDQLLNRLADYVHGGGHLVVAFKSGFCNEYSTVRWALAPGPLRAAAGFYYQEFSNLQKPLALKGDPFHAGVANQVSEWAEMPILEGAQALAYYDHPFFGKYPAITRNRFGSGTLTYEGTLLSAELQKLVLADVLKLASLDSPDQQTPAPVRVKHGISRNGKQIHYYLNYSSDPQTLAYPYGAGTDLLGQTAVAHSQSLTLKPWDLVIVEER